MIQKIQKKENLHYFTLKYYFKSLLRWFAPILSFTTEEIYKLISKNKKSIHLEKFLEFSKKFENEKLNENGMN